jgi:hypothetical protein
MVVLSQTSAKRIARWSLVSLMAGASVQNDT